VRVTSVWKPLLGVENTVVESVRLAEFGDSADVIVRVRPTRRFGFRCGVCRRPAPRYDAGRRRRWRSLDCMTGRVEFEAQTYRVACAEHGVVVAAVRWARHNVGHTLPFDQLVTWLVQRGLSKQAICGLLGLAWRTVGAIIDRVVAEAETTDPLDARLEKVRRIGIDEVSYRRGHKYLITVVDHDSGHLWWAAAGRDKQTLAQFFDRLGARCSQISVVSADGADWIAELVSLRCPQAEICLDPFHVVAWTTTALDEVRRAAWREARRHKQYAFARALQRSRFALWKNRENLTEKQRAKLDWIAEEHDKVHRAWQLKEQLRAVFAAGSDEGIRLLDTWFELTEASALPQFIELASKMRRFRTNIISTLTHELSNARAEAINLQIRLLTRVAFGFKSAAALLSLVKLRVDGYKIHLPRPTHI
jgi:transposase